MILNGLVTGAVIAAATMIPGASPDVPVADPVPVPVSAPLLRVTDTEDGFAAFIAAGFTGAVNDGMEAVYVPVGTVYRTGIVVWTATREGVHWCVDAPSAPCTGAEFLGDGWT